MLKKTIKYTDYNGVERTEDFYFNLTKAELMRMNMSSNGGLNNKLRRIINEQDTKEIIQIFEELVMNAYGKKSDDGKRFIKSKELSEEFMQTEAYSEMFMELFSNEGAAAAFINGMVPADLQKELESEDAKSMISEITHGE